MSTLDAAYRATTYRVESAEGVFDLRVRVANFAFDDYLRRHGVSCWGLVTAYNPGAVVADDANRLAQTRLRDRLAALDWPSLPACNFPDADGAPVEPSFLLLQVTEKEVCKLAAEFRQRAVLCGTIGAAPRLVTVDPADAR